ncbi:MAG TPA: choice-of-anchor Q domain-containing protein [Acidimicrobiia bacterium]|nr:choice-of-anchor Q domain-containing protein [Acidimicrobiia bacterium]
MGVRIRATLGLAAAAVLVAAPLTLLTIAAAPAGAASFGPVDPTIPDGNANSLRDVLVNQVHNGDTVQLQPGATYSLNNCGAGEITPAAAVTIVGNGATISQTCGTTGILVLENNLTVQGVTFTGGTRSGGGAVFLDAAGITLSVSNSTFTGNTSSFGGDGGAIFLDGDNQTLNVTGSTFTNNSAGDDGGAIANEGSGETYMIVGSTFNGNSTAVGRGHNGGAIDLEDPGSLTMINSTVTQNTSADDAAVTGENNTNTITLVYTDVVNNTTHGGVGAGSASSAQSPREPVRAEDNTATANVELFDPTLFTTFGSVIAQPHGGPNCSDHVGAPMTGVVSHGYNFADDTSCGLTGTGDNQATGNNPLLGALANNGGPTNTLLPQVSSPLIDGVPAASCQADGASGVTTDQRVLPRPDTASPNCEIGAVEIQPPPTPTLTVAFTG